MGIDLSTHIGGGESLRAKELAAEKNNPLTIVDIGVEKIDDRGGKTREALYALVSFKNVQKEPEEKKFYLNVTNTNRMVELFGEDTDKWKGKAISVYKVLVTNPNTNEEVDSLRIHKGK